MIAESPLSVVIQGESGTGKELIARAVHALSRRKGPLVEVNCGALPATLLESELFGFRRGAFSGAVDDRPGLIRSADRGTLFLDEIGDLPLSSQVAFLRVLEERHVVPLGGTKPIPVDLRLCAATHRDLEQLTREGGFRADLLARLAGHSLRLPPLRERREDFGILIGDLLLRIAGERAARLEFSRDTLRALLCRPWPLNVRELAKSLEHAVVLAHEQPIRPEHLPETLRLVQAVPTKAAESPDAVPSKDTESPRRDQLLDLLAKHQGNVSAIARILGKQRSQIRRWLKRYGLDSDKFRPPI